MGPADHLDWLADNIAWFEGLDEVVLRRDVPNCPGWRVDTVLTHLAFGLGLAYPVAMGAAADAEDDEVFADVAWPATRPEGSAARAAFSTHLGQCLAEFRRTDPDRPCWTYGGPGQARFWFRRAAIETSLHRLDVEGALIGATEPMPEVRALDAIEESVGFALPLAARMSQSEPAAVEIRAGTRSLTLGEGPVAAVVSGSPPEILVALWGRSPEVVRIEGDRSAADAWLGVIESAFAGR